MTEKELRQYLIDEIDLQKEFLNQHEVGFIREDEEERLSALETTLNLIEKQQEEIKELKLITNTYNSYEGKDMNHTKIIIADSNYFINGTFVKKFVSKDKIRKYLKQLEIEDKERLDYAAKELGINGLCPDLTYFKIKKELEKMIDD